MSSLLPPGASPPDPSCAECSKPIRSGTLALREGGDWLHVGCHTRTLRLRSVEEMDRARRARERATSLVESAKRRQGTPRFEPKPGGLPQNSCPFCAHPAVMTDWRPRADWIVVERCRREGFFVWAPLLGERVHHLTASDCQAVALRIRAFRTRRLEAWVATADGTVAAPLVVRTRQPSVRGTG